MADLSAINPFIELALKAKDQFWTLAFQLQEKGLEFHNEAMKAGREQAVKLSSVESPVVSGSKWFSVTEKACAVVGALSLFTYLIPTFYHKIAHRQQNLKKKYNASWALVTGGSSGIGLAIVEKLVV